MKVAALFATLGLKPDTQAWARGNALISGAKRAVAALAAGASVATAGIALLARQVAGTADDLAKMSRKLGISVESLQQLEFASQISGSNLQQLRTGLQRFARTADDTTRGLKEAQDAFRDAGVVVKDTNGDLRPLDELLLSVSERFETMPDGTEKTALAMRLFGRSGAELIPLLNEGRTGIQALREEFARTGAQISTKDAAAFEEYNDTLHRTRTVLRGLKQQIVIALLPTLQRVATAVMDWVKANREVIKTRVTQLVNGLIIALSALGKILGFVIDHWKTLAIVLGAAGLTSILAGLTAAFKVLGVTSVRAAVSAAAAWIVAQLPFLLMAAAIGAIILIVDDLWHAFTGGESVFKNLFLAAKEWLGGALSAVLDDMRKKFTDTLESLPLVGEKLRARREAVERKELQDRTDSRQRIIQNRLRLDEGDELAERIERRKEALRDLRGRGFDPQSEAIRTREIELNVLNTRASREAEARASSAAGQLLSGGGITLSSNITINSAPGQDAEEIANRVVRKQDEMVRRQVAAGRGR